jgi:hypothetical protein
MKNFIYEYNIRPTTLALAAVLVMLLVVAL